MKACGIVAEYNPFHQGHKYQIEMTKKQRDFDVVIAVMSGNFVQRGEPAIIDKWQRAEVACQNGVDLVIELPYIYATQSANYFAKGAVSILNMAKIDYLSFGSECGNLENLKEIAETPINPDNIQQCLDQGKSYPESYGILTKQMYPNDILAVSYLKELINYDIEPILIKRIGSYTDESIQELPSALSLRNYYLENNTLPIDSPMYDNFLSFKPIYMKDLYPYFRTLVLTSSKETLKNIFLIDEGIENHFRKIVEEEVDYDSFLNKATTNRYTSSRIRRSMLQIMNQVTKEEVKQLTTLDTLRILAFNSKGREYLKYLNDNDVKCATKFSKVPKLWRDLELKTTYLYTSFMDSKQAKIIKDNEISGSHCLD